MSGTSEEIYRDTAATVWSDAPAGGYRWPVVCCIGATIITAPVGFFLWGVYVEAVNPDHNPFGAVIYAFLCMTLIVPVALVNVGIIAPLVARSLVGKGAYGRALLRNAMLLLLGVLAVVGWAGVAAVCAKVFAGSTFLRVLAYTIIPWQLAMLLWPSVVTGSLVYSLAVVALRRRIEGG
jgi:hypothetical protein